MLIQRIKISNYKTYLSLDLDLTVDDDRPIILIGGANGGGKTTLFEAISGALYGLKIENKEHFMELLNQGALNTAKPEISLQITFVGKVLGQQQKYILKRVYQLNPQGKPLESVSLNMNGNMYVYGTMTAPKDRVKAEQEINKIIKANLPQELSQYFLFDAMQSSELLKKNVFAQTIRDNFENVLGFKKYLQLKRAAEKLQQEWAQQRLEAEKEAQEYNELCAQKDKLTADLNTCIAEQDTKYKYLASVEVEYKRAKDGAQEASALNKKIQELASKIDDIVKRAATYAEDLKAFVDNIEIDLFLPKLASNLAQEINNILHIKEQLQKENTGAYPLETLKDVTNKIITYLKDLSLCSESVDEEQVVSHIVAIQNSTNKEDPFGYLDEAEVTALSNLVKRTGSNQFIALDRQRQELEIQLSTLDNLRSQKQTLEQTQAGGNEYLIQNYEAAQKQIEKLKGQEAALKADIQRLEKRIHQFDVQIQQEPDIKFDTLVKLKPLFEKIADSLLKKKKAQIESEMQQQLNKLLVSYKGHVAKVELSDSIEQFNIKLYHTAGNEISLNQLNAASKQIFIQVLLKVLRNLGDYNPPVMIDTVMGVLDNESRDALMEEYFPQLAEQTILLCTTSEIRTDSDYIKLEPFISKTYTLHRNVEAQNTTVEDGYFGLTLNQ
ncbi:DNA sulfur modification protein DndD [Parabacteroides merdae]|jgi:DNA sulfur modification protein DndD|uniref:Putative DNA sulfur modification protein DndD n=1 Tax=Parabacteroides johnsonii DSM 18315 TaxID=537006 RepID=B7BEN2_9BACT|nr:MULTISPECIES: AAA family ATPase [Bacteroidales]EEC95101.1 putative DNA sulfur modification protein DndD [Parabacteroides johnsonii DSM 18315]MDR4059014.1 AAA family ATPase [Phocaeicola sp.]RGS98665.1 DNA sulfur modification protein DndD [Parabacteroides merdae]UEA91124.1 AAA family ATPase [Parabacteroides johnsonii]UWP43277.1 AAA family ATPase [Parabacteroides johnsonii DSM 18315]